MNNVCLNMIVKNEAHVIRRCLASVRPFIDSWVIVDTGSTDGTQDVIRGFLHDLPGELHERPWKNFGHNRSEAITLARERSDYLFVIDADEVLELPPGYQRPPLTEKAYSVEVKLNDVTYSRVCVVSTRLPWRYVGVLHEYLECDQPVEKPVLHGPRVIVHTDSARWQQDVNVKYAKDARVLEDALVTEPDNARYMFYLAQSYRDSAQIEKALATYDRRVAMGGWEEEVWYSMYSAALLAELLNRSEAEVIHRHLRAFNFRPQRAEALGQLARYCRVQKQFAAARLFAHRALNTPLPPDLLFIDRSFYYWRCADEFAVASYWTGDYADSLGVCETLLKNPQLPVEQRPRVLANLNFARTALNLPPLTENQI
jgi:glycosyltransferase involved in cell wall biosynthesis